VMQVNARSLAGAQAPLGYDGRGPAELRTETTRNEGDPSERVCSVGNVEVEIVQAPPNDADANADNLVEGRNDVVNVQPLPAREGGVGCGRGGRSAGRNGVTHRNVHVNGFDAGTNDPSTRFSAITHGYQALTTLTSALTSYFNAPPPGPPRGMIDIARNYHETARYLSEASDASSKEFYAQLLQGYKSEAAALAQAASAPSAAPAPASGPASEPASEA
jgi:hypothetical protein